MKDLTAVAIPVYFATMGAEYLWWPNRGDELGTSPGQYERKDTVASQSMGVVTALGAAAVTTLADALARLDQLPAA